MKKKLCAKLKFWSKLTEFITTTTNSSFFYLKKTGSLLAVQIHIFLFSTYIFNVNLEILKAGKEIKNQGFIVNP